MSEQKEMLISAQVAWKKARVGLYEDGVRIVFTAEVESKLGESGDSRYIDIERDVDYEVLEDHNKLRVLLDEIDAKIGEVLLRMKRNLEIGRESVKVFEEKRYEVEIHNWTGHKLYGDC